MCSEISRQCLKHTRYIICVDTLLLFFLILSPAVITNQLNTSEIVSLQVVEKISWKRYREN